MSQVYYKRASGIMETRAERAGGRRWLGLATVVFAAFLATGCDLGLSSPADVDEETLDGDRTIEALWSGAMGQVSHLGLGSVGTGGLFTFGALRTDELVHSGNPTGNTENFGPLPHLRAFSDGAPLMPDWQVIEDLWGQSMTTRYVADFGVNRAREIYEKYKDDPTAEIRDRVTRDRIRMHAWAGVAYRLLGDHLCHAVIDGGPLEPHTVYYERALEALNEGIAFAEENNVLDVDEFGTTAAYAVRAQINMLLGNWDAAEADAGRVATSYSGLSTGHTSVEPDRRQILWLRWLDFLEDRQMTVWGTPFLDWGFNETQQVGPDMRASFSLHATSSNPHREWGTDGRRPWHRQTKELSTTGSLQLAKGTEMRLIEAEARLRRNDLAGAIDKINEIREWYNAPTGRRFEQAGHPLEMLDYPNTQQEAWALLMRERGVDLWLEGRRLADIRRWQIDPGFVPTTVVREAGAGDASTDARRNVLDIAGDFCIPVGATESRLNPNL